MISRKIINSINNLEFLINIFSLHIDYKDLILEHNERILEKVKLMIHE